MGLLGESFDDPKTQGLLTLGLALLGSRGSLPQALAQAGQQGLMAYQGAREAADKRITGDLQRQVMMAQLGDINAQATQRTLQAQKTAGLLEALKRWGSPDASVPAANAETLRTTGSLAPTVANAQVQSGAMQRLQAANPAAGIPPEALQADLTFNDGKGIAKMLFDRGVPNIDFVSGVAVDKNRIPAGASIPTINQNGQASQLIADPSAPGGYRLQAPAGSVETYRAFRQADADVANQNDLVRVFDPASQREVLMPKSQVLGAAGGRPQGSAPAAGPNPWQVPPATQTARNSDSLAILQAELEKAGPADRPAIQREIARLQSTGSQTGVQTGLPGVAAGPSTREKASAGALDLGNQAFIKDTFTPTLEAGKAAGDMLVSVTTARNALKNLGSTGWGTPTIAAASSMLAAIGVPQAERVATNAQTFQQAAMTRLWTTLNAAKGPQTEGDAQRASQTFAQLQDTTRKNLFVLDLAQAQAERDQMRASYFREAYPLAQREGDLQRIDREWQRIQPSVFAMPSMQKWGMK